MQITIFSCAACRLQVEEAELQVQPQDRNHLNKRAEEARLMFKAGPDRKDLLSPRACLRVVGAGEPILEQGFSANMSKS